MTKGPFDTSGLPKPKVSFKVTEENQKGDTDHHRALRAVGDRMTPDSFKYVGSIAVHIYQSRMGLDKIVKTQVITGEATATEANWALQQASIATAKNFGWEGPKKRTDHLRREV